MLAFVVFPITKNPFATPRIYACAPQLGPRQPGPRQPPRPSTTPASDAAVSPATTVSHSPPPTNSSGESSDASSSPSSSALDDLPSSLKFNAVVQALARNKDHDATSRVLSEMRESDITLEPNTQTAIFDAAVSDHQRMTDLLSQVSPPGYGTVPATTNTPCAPVDPTRASDISLAACFVTALSTAASAEVLEPLFLHRPPDEPTAFLLFMFGALAIDRYVASAFTWRRIRRGLVRLFSHDPQRASFVDSASFLSAYLLGVPWICFRPDGKRALRFCKQGLHLSRGPAADLPRKHGPEDKHEDSRVIDDRIADRCLLWLVSGVAAELAIDGMLIHSDLRPAREFMFGFRLTKPIEKRLSVAEGDNRLRMAVSAVSNLLQTHSALHKQLSDVMLSGASVGECVALLSNRFST